MVIKLARTTRISREEQKPELKCRTLTLGDYCFYNNTDASIEVRLKTNNTSDSNYRTQKESIDLG